MSLFLGFLSRVNSCYSDTVQHLDFAEQLRLISLLKQVDSMSSSDVVSAILDECVITATEQALGDRLQTSFERFLQSSLNSRQLFHSLFAGYDNVVLSVKRIGDDEVKQVNVIRNNNQLYL